MHICVTGSFFLVDFISFLSHFVQLCNFMVGRGLFKQFLVPRSFKVIFQFLVDFRNFDL